MRDREMPTRIGAPLLAFCLLQGCEPASESSGPATDPPSPAAEEVLEAPASGPACAVTYTHQNSFTGGYTAYLELRNTGTRGYSGWSLSFRLGDRRNSIRQAINATMRGNGAGGGLVTLTAMSFNRNIAPRGSATLAIVVNGPAARPRDYTVNGQRCSGSGSPPAPAPSPPPPPSPAPSPPPPGGGASFSGFASYHFYDGVPASSTRCNLNPAAFGMQVTALRTDLHNRLGDACGRCARVTSRREGGGNGASIVVRIIDNSNDFTNNGGQRLLDLSAQAFDRLGDRNRGFIPVDFQVITCP